MMYCKSFVRGYGEEGRGLFPARRCDLALFWREYLNAFSTEGKEGKTADGLKLFDGHRRLLPDRLHKNQKQIDCLDYLVYILTKQVQKAR